MYPQKVILGVLVTAMVTFSKAESDKTDTELNVSQYIDMLEIKTADCDFCGMTFFGAVSLKVSYVFQKLFASF